MTLLLILAFLAVLGFVVPAMADRDARSHRMGRYGRIRHHRTPAHPA